MRSNQNENYDQKFPMLFNENDNPTIGGNNNIFSLNNAKTEERVKQVLIFRCDTPIGNKKVDKARVVNY